MFENHSFREIVYIVFVLVFLADRKKIFIFTPLPSHVSRKIKLIKDELKICFSFKVMKNIDFDFSYIILFIVKK